MINQNKITIYLMLILLLILILILIVVLYFLYKEDLKESEESEESFGLIPENTMIKLKDGKLKKIQDIKINDTLENDFIVYRIEKFPFNGNIYKINNDYLLTEGLPIKINDQLYSINPNETKKINPKYDVKQLKTQKIEKIKYPFNYTYNLLTNIDNFEIPTTFGIINNLNDFPLLDEIDLNVLDKKELLIFNDNIELLKKAFPEDN